MLARETSLELGYKSALRSIALADLLSSPRSFTQLGNLYQSVVRPFAPRPLVLEVNAEDPLTQIWMTKRLLELKGPDGASGPESTSLAGPTSPSAEGREPILESNSAGPQLPLTRNMSQCVSSLPSVFVGLGRLLISSWKLQAIRLVDRGLQAVLVHHSFYHATRSSRSSHVLRGALHSEREPYRPFSAPGRRLAERQMTLLSDRATTSSTLDRTTWT